jgi:Ca-activated chloride channel family protein
LVSAPAEGQPTDPLAGLVDIPLPMAVSLWPQTWPSRIALAMIVIGLIVATVWLVHRWRVNRYRREALSELDQIEAGADSISALELSAALGSLARRTALAAFPREQVASLTGNAWLSFLDRTGGGRDFSQGSGRSLEVSAYRQSPTDPKTQITVVRRWIRSHREGAP